MVVVVVVVAVVVVDVVVVWFGDAAAWPESARAPPNPATAAVTSRPTEHDAARALHDQCRHENPRIVSDHRVDSGGGDASEVGGVVDRPGDDRRVTCVSSAHGRRSHEHVVQRDDRGAGQREERP